MIAVNWYSGLMEFGEGIFYALALMKRRDFHLDLSNLGQRECTGLMKRQALDYDPASHTGQ